MKFCMVTTFFPPYHMGGDAVYVARLSEALARRGHEVHVVHDIDAYHASGGRAPRGLYAAPPGVTVYPLTSPFGRLSPLLTHQTGRSLMKGALHERLSIGGYDVVHFHNVSLIGLDALSWGGDSVRLLTTHEHWLVCPTSILWRYDREVCEVRECIRCTLHAGRPPQWWRGGSFIPDQLVHLHAVIAPSRFVRDMHLARGLDLKFDVLPHFAPEERAVAGGPAHPRPYFIYVGRLVKAKGVQTLFSAFRGPDGPDLVIVGDGAYEGELKQLAASLPRVHFMGRLPHDALRTLYQHARAVIVPSLCYEVFGMVVLEAFSANAPVIARERGALAEIVGESEGGLLFSTDEELREAVDRIEREPGLRESLAANGARMLEQRWTEARHLEQYFGIIERATLHRRQRTSGEVP